LPRLRDAGRDEYHGNGFRKSDTGEGEDMTEDEDQSAALHEQRQQELQLMEELERELHGDKWKLLELQLEDLMRDFFRRDNK